MTVWVPGVVIDVSKWQDSLPSLTGVIGVIARAGIGTKPDALFVDHITNARTAGEWVGSYWFNYGDLSVSQQVDAYIAREREVGGVSLHVIDWEGAEGFTAAQTAEFIRIYRQRTGDPIGLYASEGRFRYLGQDWDWIANYSQEPHKHYDMWQYGPFRGVDGNHAKQQIIDLVTAGGTPKVGPRVINLTAYSGVATIKVPGASAIQMDDGVLVDLPVGATKDIVFKGQLATPWPNHPSGIVYGVGSEAAILLAEDITPVENKPPVADCTALEQQNEALTEQVTNLTAENEALKATVARDSPEAAMSRAYRASHQTYHGE